MTPQAEALEVVRCMASAATRTPAVIDRYYTLCIPFYREFLGNHWHTGYYLPIGRTGPQDQRRMERRIAKSASVGPDCEVLDVGCGIGGPACYLASHTGARIRGLTPNATQIDLARRLARATKLDKRVTFDQGSASELPYPEESFNVVVFFESSCHFPDRDRFFREVRRVLRPGGRLAGEDWLAADGLSTADTEQYIWPICNTWAIPALDTCSGYAKAMLTAGLTVSEAVDLREEMAMQRGFIVDRSDRDEVRRDIERTTDPIRRIIMEGLLCLGEAVAAGAFTIGRFLAVKETGRS